MNFLSNSIFTISGDSPGLNRVIDKITVVFLDGSIAYSANSYFSEDALYPLADTPKVIVYDECLGTNTEDGVYHYHSYSPCILPPGISKNVVGLCDDNASCKKNKMSYAMSFIDKRYKTQMVIGVAKDGRMVYGPFKTDGSLWNSCDVDMCNGAIIDGKYAYVATVFYPYLVGCWGPSNSGEFVPSCTANPRKCLAGSVASHIYFTSVLAALALSILMLF
jgi:hypothetical protein